MSEVLETLIRNWIQTNQPVSISISKPSEEDYEDIKGYIPESLKTKFKVFCTQRQETICSVLYYLISQWVNVETNSDEL